MSSTFDQKVILITGSSAGIGKVLAREFGLLGARVMLNGRDKKKLNSTMQELKISGFNVESFLGDITRSQDCEDMINYTIDKFGGIDVLINNAGVSMRGELDQLNPDVIRSIYEINAVAPAILSKLALPHLQRSKGSVIFISSLAGLYGLPYISVYGAAKMALTGLTQAIRFENKKHSVHVGIVYVGYTEIEVGKKAVGHDGQLVELGERKGIFTDSMDYVAKNIIRLIKKRRKKTVVGISGKIFYFLVKYLPFIVYLGASKSARNTNKMYQ